jgi:two-component system, OmpR family, sensor histidine kinase BaeS
VRRWLASMKVSWSLMALVLMLFPMLSSIGFVLVYYAYSTAQRNTLSPETLQKLEVLEKAAEKAATAQYEYSRQYGLGEINENWLLAFTLLCGLAGIGVVLMFSPPITRLLYEISAAARRFAKGEYGVRVKVGANPSFAANEVHLLAQDFNQMADAFERQQQERRAFIAAVAHEVRTPLTVLRARLETLQAGTPLETEDTAQMLLQTQRLSRLMTDLGTLSLADSGQMSLNLMPIELVSLSEDVLSSFEPQAHSKNIRLRLEAVQPEIEMQADPDRIAQVLANLLENALRHTLSGGTVLVRLEPRALVVEDTGLGFEPTALEIGLEGVQRVFERFYRAEGSRSRSFGGSGLGLAIVLALMKLHHGKVEAGNRQGGFVRLSW